MNDLISIIVPVYNVELYLRECLDSLINQKYKNIEILLINDGSQDNSKLICEEYQNIDERIKLYNKTNGGLSDARNFGINRANGDYILFVDSDDVIDKNCVNILLKNAIKTNAEISICGFEKFCTSYTEVKESDTVTEKLYTPFDYIKEILCIKKNTYAWGTLIKKSIIEDIRFKKGVRYEDMEMMYKLYIKSNKIVYTDLSLCKYRQQENSIVHKYNRQNMIDYIDNCTSFCTNIKYIYPKLNIYIDQFMCNAYTVAICSSLNDELELNKYKKLLDKIIKKTIFKELPIPIMIKLNIFKININFGIMILKIKNRGDNK